MLIRIYSVTMSTTSVTQELMNILDQHLQMITNLAEQVRQLSVRLDAYEHKTCTVPTMNADAIVRGLRDQNVSDDFAGEIRNAPIEILAGLDLDLSSYAEDDSDIFDTIVAAGYDLTKSHSLDDAIYNIFECGLHYNYMLRWQGFIKRINNLTKCDQQLDIDWLAAIKKFDDGRRRLEIDISESDVCDVWNRKVDEMRANMVEAAAKQSN